MIIEKNRVVELNKLAWEAVRSFLADNNIDAGITKDQHAAMMARGVRMYLEGLPKNEDGTTTAVNYGELKIILAVMESGSGLRKQCEDMGLLKPSKKGRGKKNLADVSVTEDI